MSLDVVGHVMTKDFELVRKDLFDFLPYDFRFTFYFDTVECTYKNSYGLFNDNIYDALEKLGIMDIGWTSLVKVSDVQLFLQHKVKSEPNYVAEKMFNMFMELNPEHILVVNGDQYYSNISADSNPVYNDCDEDPWFNGCYC